MKIAAAFALALAACIIPAQQPAGGGGYSGGGGGYSGGGGPGAGAAGGEATSDPNAGGGAPAGPVNVEIHSSCPETVAVFYGDDPGYGSGTQSSVESNSIENQTFQPGDKMYIIDADEHPIASVTVGPNTRQIEISQDCNSLSAQ